jgi:hypothetical protein
MASDPDHQRCRHKQVTGNGNGGAGKDAVGCETKGRPSGPAFDKP